MQKHPLQQLEKITHLGVLIFFILLIDLGFIAYHKLTAVRKYRFQCVVIDEGYEGDSLSSAAMEGRILFLESCAACHNTNMVSDMTGPALYGCRERWQAYEGAIHKWIQNSQQLAEEGNPRALKMLEWSSTVMPSFENLDSMQIESILAYIEHQSI